MRILSSSALAGCAALLCSILFAIPASAESADYRGPVPGKGLVLGGVGGAGNQKSTKSDKGPDGSEQHSGVASAGQGGGAGGGGGAAAGAGGQDGQSDHAGVAARLADVAVDIFGGVGDLIRSRQ